MTADLDRHAASIRASGVLGRPGQMTRLFDYLVSRAHGGQPPTEGEIATEVFQRDHDFVPALDAVVRVNIYRLRRKLEEHHLRASQAQDSSLIIPKGEYRLVVVPAGQVTPISASEKPRAVHPRLGRPSLSRRAVLAGGAGLLALNIAGWGLTSRANSAHVWDRDIFASSPWKISGQKPAPLLVVVGDYYIFADTDERGNVLRLVREFFINSRDELYEHMMHNADELEYRYMDLDLSYLPMAVAFALKDLAPLVATRPESRIIAASDLTPQLLRDHDILYIGYISGLGILREAAFRQTRFSMGAGADELVDASNGRRYRSEAGTTPLPRGLVRDYGYFSTFTGPGGNRIWLVAGMRDVGLAGAAAAMSRAATLDSLPRLERDQALEALFQVEGQGAVNFNTKLIAAAPKEANQRWTAAPPTRTR